MERLTKRLEDGQAAFHECHGTCGTCDGANCYCIGPMVDRLASYEDSGLEPEQVLELKSFTQGGIHKIDDGWKHVQELLQAEQDSRLVVLPCKAGDHVWVDGREAIVENFFGYKTERYLHAQFYDSMQYIDIPFTEIGKTAFLTNEDADHA